jgi:hypothetical protein
MTWRISRPARIGAPSGRLSFASYLLSDDHFGLLVGEGHFLAVDTDVARLGE